MHSVSALLLKQSDKSWDKLEASGEEALFYELERQRFTIPKGCLAGACGLCRIEVIEGAENLTPPTPIEEITLENFKEDQESRYGKGCLAGKQIRLSCKAQARGSIKIQVFGEAK